GGGVPGEEGGREMEALHPSLYSDASDLADLRAEVRASTLAKTKEIAELRGVVAAGEATRLANCAEDMAARFAAGGRLFAFGNGGSATHAQEIATLFLSPRGGAPPPPPFGLAHDTSLVAALCNAAGVDVVVSRQLAAFGRREDIAVGLSTSGNSENLIRAFAEASRRGMLTVGLAGYEGGAMAELDSIDYLFIAPSSSVHRIQEAQTTIYHVLWELTLAAFAPRRAAR